MNDEKCGESSMNLDSVEQGFWKRLGFPALLAWRRP